MFNVSARKIVVSAIAIAAPVALSFGANTEAWGGPSTHSWGKHQINHDAATHSWGKKSTTAATHSWGKKSTTTVAATHSWGLSTHSWG